jgi:hypothetical protein
MKKLIFLTLGLILFNSLVMSQTPRIVLVYDDSGNRYQRLEIFKIKSAEADLVNESDETKEQIDDLFERIKVFPNPVKDYLKIELNQLSDITSECSLYDINGRALSSFSSTDSTYEIDLSHYAPGNYVLVLIVQDRKLQYKVIKH